jgi:hypothetical protein
MCVILVLIKKEVKKMAVKRLNVGVPVNIHARFKTISIEYGVPVSALVITALIDWLDKRDALAIPELYRKLEAEKLKESKK